MTTWYLLIWLAAGVLLTGLGGVGTKALYGFSRRQMELYCRRRNRRALFDEILDRHETMAVAAETLQVVGTVIMILATGLWFFPDGTRVAADQQHIARVAVTAIIVLLALTTWIPWAIVRVGAAPLLYHTWPLWKLIAWILWPLARGVELVDGLVHRLAGKDESPADEEEAFEDEVRTIVTAGMRDGLLEADAREMIEGVMELGDVDVAEIMTPRSEVDALDVEMTWRDVLQFVVEVGRTRIPVYEKTLDRIVGILYVKDILVQWSEDTGQPRKPLRDVLRKPWCVPMTKRVDDLLREFRRTRSHMAIVVDEYRALAGVVTIEDALEEIVGEIADELDDEEEIDLVRIDHSTVEADGRVHIDELNDLYGLNLPESDEYDTIAGFIIGHLRRIPPAGTVFHWQRLRLIVLKSTPRRIERVRIQLLEESAVGGRQDEREGPVN